MNICTAHFLHFDIFVHILIVALEIFHKGSDNSISDGIDDIPHVVEEIFFFL